MFQRVINQVLFSKMVVKQAPNTNQPDVPPVITSHSKFLAHIL